MLLFFLKLYRTNSDTTADLNHTVVTNTPDLQQHLHTQTHNENDSDLPPYPRVNGVDSLELPLPSTPLLSQERKKNEGRGEESHDVGGGPGPDYAPYPNHHPNGCGNLSPCKTMPHNRSRKSPPSRSDSGQYAPQGHPEETAGPLHNPREQQDNVVLRRGFVPRTAPERVAQRKSSMAQLQQWVNQRRGMASQENINR